LPGTGSNGGIKVRVAVFAGDKEIGVRFVDLRVQYSCRQIVARDNIPTGARITEQNTKVESVLSNNPESPDWKAPYGLVARRNISAGGVINAGMVRQIKPEILVRRNKHVAVVISRPGLAITAIGRALEDGHVGEYIKVQMRITDSSRTIIARVNNDGTVEPVL
jgi:flagella basal body P-ring formation protein FlgA